MLESCWRMLVDSKRATFSTCWQFIQQIATSNYQHLLVACNNVEDLALVHFAPSGRSGAFGLRSALRFAGLLTEEATVTACPYRYRYWWSGLVFVFLTQSRDAQCINWHKHKLYHLLPHPRTSLRKLHLVSRGSRDMDSFYRDSMDQCNLWTLDRIDIFPLASCFLFRPQSFFYCCP